jgi:hypothetical protein
MHASPYGKRQKAKEMKEWLKGEGSALYEAFNMVKRGL